MRLTSNGPQSRRVAQVALFVLALALTAFGIAGLAGRANAGPVSLKFDNGQASLGGIIQNKVILPADDKFPSPDLPVPQRTDVELMGTETNGNLSFPATTNTGLQFPYMHVLSPIDPTLKVPLTFRLKDPGLTGTYDAATGETSLKGVMDVIVVLGLGATPNPLSPVDAGVPPLGLFGRCRLANIPVDFSTENKAPFTGQRFKAGNFGVDGAMTTGWDDLPAAKTENGTAEQKGLCEEQLDTIIHGPGGLWLSNSVVTPKPQPVPEETCADDLRLCPLPKYAEISGVKVSPRKKTVKAGKRIKLKVKVKNTGTRSSKKTRVRLRSSNRWVKIRRSIALDVPAGSAATRKVTVKVKGKAKGKARITASTQEFSSRSILKIRATKN